MLPISALLNPEPEPSRTPSSSMAPLNQASTVETVVPKTASAQCKMISDALELRSGPPRGPINYPPCEYYDAELSEIYEKHAIRFTSRTRHIPYNPARSDFYERTGRKEIDIFGYEFKVPGEDQTILIIWDYTTGLVRTTGIFKCYKPWGKTLPAKVLNKNLGLKKVCHKLTGGVIESQGYYMPFGCAKAIAKKFCWHVRYAFTPIFGLDFPGQCLPPDHPEYRQWEIDQHIIRVAAEEARAQRCAALAYARPYPSPSPDDGDDDDDTSLAGYLSSNDDDNCPPSTASNGWTPINTPRMQLTPPPSPSSQDRSSPQGSQGDEATSGWVSICPTALAEALSDASDAMDEDPDDTEVGIADNAGDDQRVTLPLTGEYTEAEVEAAYIMVGMSKGGPIDDNYPKVCPRCHAVIYMQELREATARRDGWQEN
ncbi:putative APSES transcription factor Xbp1 [Aspergillus brunneoviolaceus CBS 621.78]|uniref:DNA-binding domain of Mlu1-box binding protein MBP1 n=1 Tax=Aspergillus brunneoviolaceus CBS 621.78 TaxID=1450534 RepID=A0ACD1GDQ6_9EURO|nr:DNA-binding domain of Mlu1-box binding protein MBP1 [Aspergillus brunneoviolaceus CBS 621.78]RAH47236.1 DNA-binding domain of Mlu1-box binding protein MBP1 [Aspergillus brunneoviolaceus CBS 621.78]